MDSFLQQRHLRNIYSLAWFLRRFLADRKRTNTEKQAILTLIKIDWTRFAIIICLFRWAGKLKLHYDLDVRPMREGSYSKRNLKTLHVDSLITPLQVMHSIFFQNICCSSPDTCKTLHQQSVTAKTYQHHRGFTETRRKTTATYQRHLRAGVLLIFL